MPWCIVGFRDLLPRGVFPLAQLSTCREEEEGVGASGVNSAVSVAMGAAM